MCAPPLAHAASFKRLGWVPPLSLIKERYNHVFGALPEQVEKLYSTHEGDPVAGAALLWHMIYSRVYLSCSQSSDAVFVFNLALAEKNEQMAYFKLFEWLGKPVPQPVLADLEKRAGSNTDVVIPQGRKVHDFNRSAAQANGYWQSVLSADEVELVNAINAELWANIESL